MFLDLCEDDQTRSTICQMQQQEARKRRHAFGVRDSRRQSRRRKKFESPQPLPQPQNGANDNPFSARSAIRRLSLRDKNMTPARIEAAREEANILRYGSQSFKLNHGRGIAGNCSKWPRKRSIEEEENRGARFLDNFSRYSTPVL